MNATNTFPEERYSEEELTAREEAQRRTEEHEELLSLFGSPLQPTHLALPQEDEPLPF